MTLQMFSVIAEHEARMISDRTRVALAAAKQRGTALGKTSETNFTDETRRLGSMARRNNATRFYSAIMPMINQLRDSGCTQAEIARRLNETGQRNSKGNPYSAGQISRLLNR